MTFGVASNVALVALARLDCFSPGFRLSVRRTPMLRTIWARTASSMVDPDASCQEQVLARLALNHAQIFVQNLRVAFASESDGPAGLSLTDIGGLRHSH